MMWNDELRSRRHSTSVAELDRYVTERVKGWKVNPASASTKQGFPRRLDSSR